MIDRRESRFRDHLLKVMKGKWHAQRIEDKFSVGVPDLNTCIGGHEIWMELKCIQSWPVLDATTLQNKLRHLTGKQINWMNKRRSHGGRCFLFMKVDTKPPVYYLYHSDDCKTLKECNKDQAINLAIGSWWADIDTNQLIREITLR